MSEIYAYYNKSEYFSAYKIVKVGLMRGADAMHFEGERVLCTEEIKEGSYYDENTQTFITAQEFETNREKYTAPPPVFKVTERDKDETIKTHYQSENLPTTLSKSRLK